jgi:hypothetical protein
VCGQTATAFRPTGAGHFVTENPVPCAYPVFQIAGDVQPSEVSHQISIEGIDLRPLSSAGR